MQDIRDKPHKVLYFMLPINKPFIINCWLTLSYSILLYLPNLTDDINWSTTHKSATYHYAVPASAPINSQSSLVQYHILH